MSTRQIATSTLWQFGSQIAMATLSIVTVKFVAVGLSKELAGNYNSAYSYLQIFGILADFGLYAVAVREVSMAKDKARVLGTLFVLRAVILVLSLGAALIIAWLLPAWRGTPLPIGITLAAFVPFFTLLAGMLRATFQVHYKMHRVFIAEVTQRIVSVGIVAAVVVGWNLRDSDSLLAYELMLIAGGVGAFILFIFSYFPAQKLIPLRPQLDPAVLKSYLRMAAPYGLAFLCTALYRQFDVTLIALLRPDYEIQNAHYGFVQRIMDMGYLLPTFLLNSTLPMIGEREAEGKDSRSLMGKTFFLILILGSTMFLFAFLWSVPIMRLLTTDAYLSTPTTPGSDAALHWLSFSMFFNGLVLYAFYALLARRRWRSLVMILALGALLSIALNIFLIPDFGFIGAALTSVVTHAFLALALFPISLQVLPIEFPRALLLRWLLFTALLAAVLYLLMPFLTTIPAIIIGMGTAGIALFTIAFGLQLHRIVGR